MIDPAMCRPGRLDKLLYVDLPGAEERVEIVRTMLRKVPLRSAMGGGGVVGGEEQQEGRIVGEGGGGQQGDGGREETQREVERVIRERGEGYSGADLAAVVREAGVLALRKTLGTLAMMESGGATSAMRTGEGKEEEEDVDVQVGVEDFVLAMEKVPPSVSRAQRRKYEALRAKFAGMPVGGARAKAKAVTSGIDLDAEEEDEQEDKGKEVGMDVGGQGVAA